VVERPEILPTPPIAAGTALPWDQPVTDAVSTLAAARRNCGDTFIVDSGPDRYLFTFSARGVSAFYALPEDHASKGVADWRMLRRKLPDEIFDGRRTLPHDLFGRADAAAYLAHVNRALDATVVELGDSGSVDLFDLSRRLGHRVGLAAWGGPGSAEEPTLSTLTAAFDILDGSDSFVHPDAMAAVAANDKRSEREALERIVAQFAEAAQAVEADPDTSTIHPLFARIVRAWQSEEGEARYRGIAHDAALIHIASMSNLFAAVGWMLADLLPRPDAASKVAHGDGDWAKRCALESTRLAQRSIMSRYVLKPIEMADTGCTYHVATGVTIATLLPMTNTSAGPGLGDWDPDRWGRNRLVRPSLSAPELVTVFGHGKHTCPAQPFAVSAMSATAIKLLATYEWEPRWKSTPQPVAAQIGGVARSSDPCLATYRRRPNGS
jgi:cytochrome P450